jgi:hypothetical protein
VKRATEQPAPTICCASLIATIVTVESAVCRCAARELAAVGATTVIGFSSAVTHAQDLVNEIRSAGGRAWMIPVEPTMPASAWAFVEKVVAQLGALHLLVCDVATLSSPRYRPDVRGPWSPLSPLEATEFLCNKALAAMSIENLGRIALLGDDTEDGLRLLRRCEQRAARAVTRSACVASVESLSTAAADACSGRSAEVTDHNDFLSSLLGPDISNDHGANPRRSRGTKED